MTLRFAYQLRLICINHAPVGGETEVNLFLAAGNPYLPTFCIIEHQEGEEEEGEEDDDDDGDSGAQARESTEMLPVQEQKGDGGM